MKKQYLVLILLVLITAALPLAASAATSGTCGNSVTWKLDSSGVLTISGKGKMANYKQGTGVIPWDTKSVKQIKIQQGVSSIGDWAFYYCTSLTSVTIPDSVTSIGEGAFDWCYKITEAVIPNSVTSIGAFAFSGCRGLQKVNIPNSVTSMGQSVFSHCESLKSVTIGNKLKTIDYGTFSYCSNLASVTIPDSVTKIGSIAFTGCTSLVSVTIPKSVTSISGDAFSACTSLTSINVAADNPSYTDVEGVLYNKAVTELITFPAGIIKYTFPGGITSIGSDAFYGCVNITSVVIPKGVAKINIHAFLDCSSLTSVTIPNSVTEISDHVFDRCSSDLVIQCEPGTKAEEYARANGIKVKLLEAAEKPTVTEQPRPVHTAPPLPVITAQPQSVKVTAGSTAAFAITASGAESCQWYSRPSETAQWTPVSGGSSASYTFTAEKDQNGWQFCCQVTNFYGMAYSDIAVLTVSVEHSAWDCPGCGRTGNTGNYCGGCAHPAPWMETP